MAEGQNAKYFDLSVVHDHFNRALVEEDDVNIREYLNGYNELNKFFQLMGRIFMFVSSDLKSKIEHLNKLLAEEKYVTIKSMIEYEKQNDVYVKPDSTNGARTLLRLHRGLDFIREFLAQLGELSNDTDAEKTKICCQTAYGKTLANFHPWLIRKSANLAMCTMPSRSDLLQKVCGEKVQHNLDILPKMLELTDDVFNRTHNLYKLYDLHDLP